MLFSLNFFMWKTQIYFNCWKKKCFFIRPSKKMFWFSDNGFKKKGKVGRVFIFCFYFQSNMGRVFIFCFYFQQFKNITQTSSTDTSYFRSKLTKGLLFSPTSFMSVKSPTNILLHNSATVIVLSTGKNSPRNYLFGT